MSDFKRNLAIVYVSHEWRPCSGLAKLKQPREPDDAFCWRLLDHDRVVSHGWAEVSHGWAER